MIKHTYVLGTLDMGGYKFEETQLHWWYSQRANQYVLEISALDDGGDRWEPALISPVGVGFIPPGYDPARHCYLKTYSECKGLLEAFVAAGVVRETGVYTISGFARMPLVEILFAPQKENAHAMHLD